MNSSSGVGTFSEMCGGKEFVVVVDPLSDVQDGTEWWSLVGECLWASRVSGSLEGEGSRGFEVGKDALQSIVVEVWGARCFQSSRILSES